MAPRTRSVPRTGVALSRSPPKLIHAPVETARTSSGGAPRTTLARSEHTLRRRTSVAVRERYASPLLGNRPVGMPLRGRQPRRDWMVLAAQATAAEVGRVCG